MTVDSYRPPSERAAPTPDPSSPTPGPHAGSGSGPVSPLRANRPEALGTRHVPLGSFAEDVRIPYRFNRLLLYSANLIHSASAYCGRSMR